MQTPFNQGFNARMRGAQMESNPYIIGDIAYYNWREGWYEADKTTDDCENGRSHES